MKQDQHLRTSFELPVEAYANLAGQALMLVDPASKAILFASERARELLSLNGAGVPRSISDLFPSQNGLESRLRMALSTSHPVVFGAMGNQKNDTLTVKAQRFDAGHSSPLVLLSLDGEPELSRRFRSLTEQLLALNDEVDRRRMAEEKLSANMASLRRLLDVVRCVSDIATSGQEHLALATDAITDAFDTTGAVMVIRTGSILQCVATTGAFVGTFSEERPLDIDEAKLFANWAGNAVLRDKMLLDAVSTASGQTLDPCHCWVLPMMVMGEPKGALICFGDAGTSGISTFESGIIAEALSSLLWRADMEARLIHGQKLEAIGRLTGGIAHDFNNILAVVLGNAELLLDEVATADTQFARAIMTAAERGATLTSQLLSFARKQLLRPERTDINKLVRSLDPMVRRALAADIDIQVVTAAGLWRAVIDHDQLEAALLNLVTNSRDAMPGGGRLTIETGNARLDDDYAAAHDEVTPGQYVMIAVSDTGLGMEHATAAQAFLPFFTTKEDGRGSGLGLSMVYGFVKQSGGHVKIYTERGRGTTVRVYLPRDPDRANTAPCGAPPISETAALPGCGRILLVEDDPAVLQYTKKTLSILGYSVDAVLNGTDAIELLDREVYDLVLTDVVLPGRTSGRVVSEHARKVAPRTAVLFMSGYTENAIVHHGLLDADAELLAKPFTRNQLSQKIKGLIGSR